MRRFVIHAHESEPGDNLAAIHTDWIEIEFHGVPPVIGLTCLDTIARCVERFAHRRRPVSGRRSAGPAGSRRRQRNKLRFTRYAGKHAVRPIPLCALYAFWRTCHEVPPDM